MFSVTHPPNWLGAQNPFNLPRPPIWWLKRLWDRDCELRVLPGLTMACYRIARRSHFMKGVKPTLGNDSETGRLCRELCSPIVSLQPGVQWDARFFQWLDEHDTWAVQTHYRNAADVLDEFDVRAQQQVAARKDDDADVRSVSAWHALQLRTGQKAFVQNPMADQLQMSGSPVHTAPDLETLLYGSLPGTCAAGPSADASVHP